MSNLKHPDEPLLATTALPTTLEAAGVAPLPRPAGQKLGCFKSSRAENPNGRSDPLDVEEMSA